MTGLGGQPEAGAEFARATWRRLFLWGAPANVGGVLVLVLFLLLLGPLTGDAGAGALVRNVVALVLYLAVAFPLSIAWRRRQFAPVQRWLAAERLPTEAEREVVLRQPLDSA